MRPLYACILAHATSSYLAGLVFVAVGYAVMPDAMARTPGRAWAGTVMGSPIVFPTVSVFSMITEGARGAGTMPHVASTAVYVALLPLTYVVFRRFVRLRRHNITVGAASAARERVADGG
jgi:hypothetical protein